MCITIPRELTFEPCIIHQWIDPTGRYDPPMDRDFPFFIKLYTFADATNPCPPNWHERLEIFVGVAGDGLFHMGDRLLPFSPGDVHRRRQQEAAPDRAHHGTVAAGDRDQLHAGAGLRAGLAGLRHELPDAVLLSGAGDRSGGPRGRCAPAADSRCDQPAARAATRSVRRTWRRGWAARRICWSCSISSRSTSRSRKRRARNCCCSNNARGGSGTCWNTSARPTPSASRSPMRRGWRA